MSILVDEYEPDVDVEVDPFGEERDVHVRTDVWVTTEYDILPEILGRGRFGEVKRCRQCSTAREFAAKFILAPRPQDKKDVEHEVEMMKKLRHRRLLQVYDAFSFKNETCLILEIIQGGELFDRVIDETFILTEKACKCFVRQICEGVEYMHASNIIHLDLKPENILCLSKTGNRIKIIDFGLAREYDPRKELRVLFGTPEFMAPEVVQYDTINFSTDIWSIGVISYVLLSGLSPFMGDSDGDTLTNVIKVDYSFDYDEFADISEDAKDLIRNVLQRDKRKRLSAVQCLAHPWLKRDEDIPPLSPSLDLSKQRLRRFVYRRKWQKAVHAIIALRRMGAQFIMVARKRSLTRMEAAAHAKREAEKKATGRGSPLTEGTRSCSNEPKAKDADVVITQADKDIVARTATLARKDNPRGNTQSETSVGNKKSTPIVSTATLARKDDPRGNTQSETIMDNNKSTPIGNVKDDKPQRHSNDENTAVLSGKQSETIRSDKTVTAPKKKAKAAASDTEGTNGKPKAKLNNTNETDVASLKDKLKHKSQQSQAKDNANFAKKDSPVIGVNKSVIFQLPTLRKTPKKTSNIATPKKPQAGDITNDRLTNKSMPKWKHQKSGADQKAQSTAKDTSADKHVEPKAKCNEFVKRAESKEKVDDVVKRSETKAKYNDVKTFAELEAKDNVAFKRAQTNTTDNGAATCAGVKTKDDGASKRAHDSKVKEPSISLPVEPTPSEACLARNAVNRSPMTDSNQKEPRRYEKRPSSEIGDAAKTEDFDDLGSVESINRLCMQWPPPETDKTLLPWKPRIRIINKVGDVLKPDGTIDEELTIASISGGQNLMIPEAEKLVIKKAEDRKLKPIVLPPKPKIQFQPKPDDDRPKVPEKPDVDKYDVINGPPRVTKRPKRPCLNGEDAPDGGVRRTSGGRRALVLDRCPWSRNENNDADERKRKPTREPAGVAKTNNTTVKLNSDTEPNDSGTTISTTNKTTTSSILRRASLLRRGCLGSDEERVAEEAAPGKNPWVKPRRKSEKRITRRDEVNDTLYLSVNDNAMRRPRRRTNDGDASSDGESMRTTSEVAASDDVSDGSCDTASEAGSTRVCVMDAVAKWMNKAKTNNGVDYRRWRRGESTPSAPDSPEMLSSETAPLGRGSSSSSLYAASPTKENASWPDKTTSAYVER